jgi:OFA family oxalate/formate antiporter-like MFS transporter
VKTTGIEAALPTGPADYRRAWQLLFGVLCMVMIANLQYGWTLFVTPIDQKYHFGRAAIQVAFTLFVLTETWLVPLEGYLIDRMGPRLVTFFGGALVGLSWTLNAFATSLAVFYIAAALGGVGAGIVYGAAVGNSLKWFPDRRGLAAGVTAAGFGAGSALTIVPIARLIESRGYETAFLWFGVVQGLAVMVLALALRAPGPGDVPQVKPSTRVLQGVRDFTPMETLRSPIFWLMYVMFVAVATGGLMATAQLAPIANDFRVAKIPVSLLGITLPALTFALSIDRVLNGVTRPFFGWVSDQIGREVTMFVAFMLEGFGILLLLRYGADPLMFVILSGLVFFAWGEIYSLFPATCGDVFGRRFATTNYGMLYTAKGTAALLVPLSSVLSDARGWSSVFLVASILNFVAAILAIAVLKPLRARALSPVVVAQAPAAAGVDRHAVTTKHRA